MLVAFILLVISLAILVKSSDYFVDYSSRIAQRLGISQFVIGLTLVALGTSLPELVSSVYASYIKNSDLVIGNILGSNVANIGLIIGVGAILMTISSSKKMFYQDGLFLLGVTLLFYIFLLSGQGISRIEGIILLVLFVGYTLFTLNKGKNVEYYSKGKNLISLANLKTIYRGMKKIVKGKFKESILFDFFIVILSSIGIFIGAKYTVIEAIIIANDLAIPEYIIAFTVVAIGTSLPELSVTISSARKGLGDILAGNVIGSNIANLLLVGGAAAIINPLKYTPNVTAYLMIGLTILFLVMLRTRWKLHKTEGFFLLVIYFIMMLWIIKGLFIS